ncbi:hypothetical protein [Ruminococcus sp.]|uniref:hypothetical protein n=1 Tax=Ruminococcus sp. TaxID=41978 RepID=UPI00386AE4F7
MARVESYQQYAIVSGDSAQQLTDRLNKKLNQLRKKQPTVTFEGLIARISYTEDERILEDVSDEYEAAGIKLTCQMCPLFRPMLKLDGTIDKRAKWGGCDYALGGHGQTCKTSRACNRLFEMINSGEVELCLAD